MTGVLSYYVGLQCAIRELDGQRHELRRLLAANRVTIHHLWKRIGEQEISLDAALARAEAAEADMAAAERERDVARELLAMMEQERNEALDERDQDLAERVEEAEARVRELDAEIARLKAPAESFEDWHARECPHTRSGGRPCAGLEHGFASSCEGPRWNGRTCGEVYEAEVGK